MPAPWLLALGLLIALLVLIPARRLQTAGMSSRVIGGYAVLLWLLAFLVAVRPVATRYLVPILVLAYLAPFVAAPDRVGRFLRRGRPGPGGGSGVQGRGRTDGPGADGRDVKDVTPPEDRPV
jgi:hypothetical protein